MDERDEVTTEEARGIEASAGRAFLLAEEQGRLHDTAVGRGTAGVSGGQHAQAPRLLDLEHIFAYHAPGPKEQAAYVALREAGFHLASAIQELVPPGADQQAAIRKVREAVMTANASVALGGRLER